MSGHSKWAGIKHKKAAVDAKKGKMFTRIIREITIAARQGGGNPEHNPRLRKAIEDSKTSNMPADNVKKAVQRGTGELPGVEYEELVYEGYGPNGVAVMVEVTTDNKNRTHAEVKKIFSSHGGSIGETGCVGWMFHQKGYICIEKDKISEDDVMAFGIESGAEDVKSDDDKFYEVFTAPADFEAVAGVFKEKNVEPETAEITMIPTTYVNLSGDQAKKMISFIDALDAHDDVKNVYSNFSMPESEE